MDLFTVQTVLPRTKMNKSGVFYEVYEVHYRTSSGVEDIIDIAKDKYTSEYVREQVLKAAQAHEDILKL